MIIGSNDDGDVDDDDDDDNCITISHRIMC